MQELGWAQQPVLVERGEDDSVLLIAFTGFVFRLSMRVHEFFDLTKTLGYSRILLRDDYRVWYHHGVDRERADYPSLIRYLREEIERLKPKTVICLGTSAGGYAAIVAGHQLGADYVHAFAPHTFLDVSFKSCLGRVAKSYFRWSRLKLLFSRVARPEFFDLADLLKNYNGKTVYYIHHCTGAPRDMERVRRILGLPGVVAMPYPCISHSVPAYLAKSGFLKEILQAGNQQNLPELARAYFSNLAT
jgi:hypothetical protein